MLANTILDSLYRCSSAADLASMVATAPHAFTVRAAAAEAGQRAPHVAQVLTALADRLARTMSDLNAAKLRAAIAATEPAPQPVKVTRKPRKATAAVSDAATVPEKLGKAHATMPERWEELTPTQLAWFERWSPQALASKRYTPASRYALYQDGLSVLGQRARRLREQREKLKTRGGWDPREDIEGLICIIGGPKDASNVARAIYRGGPEHLPHSKMRNVRRPMPC